MIFEVVLGNRINDDGSMSKTMLARLNKAIEVYNDKKPDFIVVSGGPANPKANTTEANEMLNFLVSHNIPGEKILKEDKSLTTVQNGKYCKKLLKGKKIDLIYLVSSDYHFDRKFLSCYGIFKRNFLFKKIIRCSCPNVD